MDTYKATNTLNGKFYIGSSVNFEKRRKEHLKSTLNYPFQNALRANPEAFEWEVWSDDSEDRELEQALLDMWYGKEQCYNLSPYAKGGCQWVANGHCWVNNGTSERYVEAGTEVEEGWELGRLPAKLETRQKMTETLKKREDNPFKRRGEDSMSHGRRWVTTVNRNEEKYLKPEEEIPEGWIPGRMKRPPRSEESRNRTSRALRGKTKSIEHRQKLREAALAYYAENRSLPSGVQGIIDACSVPEKGNQ